MEKETFSEKGLTLDKETGEKEVLLRWHGRSTAREPRHFLAPILTRALDEAIAGEKTLVLDFRQLEYFNSSTVTPVVRLLQEAKSRGGKVTVRYQAALKWQELSFSALQVFHSDTDEIRIEGD